MEPLKVYTRYEEAIFCPKETVFIYQEFGFMSIRAKVIFLVAAISLAAFIGFGVFIYNASTMRDMDRGLAL